ncbi:MAG: hypothetical protein KAJ05_08215, partial [Candidatus Latescibacteria bacterium]|nr:hypothetical protein [Candidatus Latescibacterota bacterium]
AIGCGINGFSRIKQSEDSSAKLSQRMSHEGTKAQRHRGAKKISGFVSWCFCSGLVSPAGGIIEQNIVQSKHKGKYFLHALSKRKAAIHPDHSLLGKTHPAKFQRINTIFRTWTMSPASDSLSRFTEAGV